MQVPLLDLKAQLAGIRPEVDQQIREVVDSCIFINGPKVTELENAVASYVSAGHAIGVSSGTDALLVALMGLDVGPDDLVLTTPYSFFATAGCVSRLGAVPVFVDIDPVTYNLSPAALGQWFADHPNDIARVKAVIPVHLYGQAADLGAILPICKEHGIPVIEDAAQAVGTQYLGPDGAQRVGALGDVGCFSFFPSKNLGGFGDGGMVVVNDDDLAARIRKLKNHGSHPKYYHDLIGGNFRLDAIQAAVLLAKLPHLDDWHAARQRNAAYYDDALADVPQVQTPAIAQDRSFHIYNQYVLRCEQRDALRTHLNEAGIGSEIYYPVPFHLQNCFASLGHQRGAFVEAERAAAETLAIPVYPELTAPMRDYVVDRIRNFYG